MSALARKKAKTDSAFIAAARHFEKMAKLFASPKAKNPPYLSSSTIKAFEKAPRDELVSVDAALNELLTQLNRRVGL